MPNPENVCDHKAELILQYTRSTREYAEAVAYLQLTMETLSRDDYRKLSAYVEKIRGASEAARLALDQHVAEHGC